MSRQNGSALVLAAVSTVTILLIGLLGWVFYNAYMQHDKKPDSSSSAQKPMAMDENMDMDCLDHEKLCFALPSGAAISQNEKTSPDSTKSDTALITAFAKFTYINTGVTGVGGACDEDTKDMLTIVETAKTDIVATPSEGSNRSTDVYAVKAYFYESGKGYVPMVFLSNAKEIQNSGQKISTCLPELYGLYEAKNVNAGLVSAASYNFGMKDYDYQPTSDAAVNMLSDQGLSTSYTILKSAHYME